MVITPSRTSTSAMRITGRNASLLRTRARAVSRSCDDDAIRSDANGSASRRPPMVRATTARLQGPKRGRLSAFRK
jgi:hypothetical protein